MIKNGNTVSMNNISLTLTELYNDGAAYIEMQLPQEVTYEMERISAKKHHRLSENDEIRRIHKIEGSDKTGNEKIELKLFPDENIHFKDEGIVINFDGQELQITDTYTKEETILYDAYQHDLNIQALENSITINPYAPIAS